MAGGVSGAIDLKGFGGSLVRNVAGGLANAATRSLLDGTDFGDNVLAALPDAIGTTIGQRVARSVAGGFGAGPSGGAAGDGTWTPSQGLTTGIRGSGAMLDAALADAQYALGAATMRTVDLDGDGVASASELETARQNVRLREDQSPPDGAFEGSRSGASDGMGQRGGPEIAVERRVTYSRSQLTAWRADFERANAVIRAVYNQDASNYAEGIRAIDYRFEQLNRLDQLAFEQVDLPIMYFTGGIVGGAAVAAGGSILAGGYAGVTAFGINITFDGLSSEPLPVLGPPSRVSSSFYRRRRAMCR